MKTKIPFLIAASFLVISVTKAQYGAPCADNRIVIQGQYVIPGRAVVALNYSNSRNDGYNSYPDRRNDYGQNNDRRDWRVAEYDRYCRETRGFRMSRADFYRTRCDDRRHYNPAPQKVIVYRY